MAALPYIQLYVADYLADTQHLSLEEHGAYLLIIFNYWQRGKAPCDDDKRFASICSTDVQRWLQIRSALVEFFEVKDGCWIHHRIEKDLDRVRRKSEQAAYAGKASGAVRLAKSSNTNGRSIPVERKTNDTDTDTDTDTYIKKEVGEKISPCPHLKIVSLYNQNLPTLTKVKESLWNGVRANNLKARWTEEKERQSEDWWIHLFEIIARTPFLLGENERGWKADLGWIVKRENLVKIIEGKYKTINISTAYDPTHGTGKPII